MHLSQIRVIMLPSITSPSVAGSIDGRRDKYYETSERLRQANHLSISPSHPGQLSLLPSAGWELHEYQPKCSNALLLGVKGRYGYFVDKRVVATKTVVPYLSA